MRAPSVSRRGLSFISSVVLLLVCALLLVFAVVSPGYPVRHLKLHDGGVWVTNDAQGLYGRLNKPIRQLDAGFFPPGGAQSPYDIDMLQNDNWVVAIDNGKSRLIPVDTSRAGDVSRSPLSTDSEIDFPAGYQAAMGATSMSLVDPSSGKLWASRIDSDGGTVATLGGLNPQGKPVNTLGGAADATVGVDGTVYAASATTHKLVTIAATGDGLGKPQGGTLGAAFTKLQLSAVGDKMVALNPESGVLQVGAHTVTVPGVTADRKAALQQPGPAADEALVATYQGLYAINFSGKIRAVYGPEAGATAAAAPVIGSPARPVRLGDCMHGAWNGTPGSYVQSCNDAPGTKFALPTGSVLEDPVFRVNRDEIVLNDRVNGGIWDIDAAPQKIDDWNALKPPPRQKNSTSKTNKTQQQSNEDRPPVAAEDKLGARPGHTTVLHVMDNDSDPDGDVLAVSNVTQPRGASTTISPDGQTVQIAVPESASGTLTFRYTINDGKGQSASAAVNVEVRANGANQPPNRREGYKAPTLTVVAGGTISYPVLADWRDYDGDPLVLANASVADNAGTATTTEDGQVVFVAGPNKGSATITYRITDNLVGAVSWTLPIRVLERDSLETVAPQARPDSARGFVGQPVQIRPLSNDIPGSDPTDDKAHLTIAAQVSPRGGAQVSTDLAAGTITVKATKPGTISLDYLAAFGSAKTDTGTIRVDIAPAVTSSPPPVAMPDTAVLHGQQSITMDPLANDYAPSGGVLVVQSATPADTYLRVGVVKGHWLRIESSSAASTGSHVVKYTITDGLSGPVSGEVAVTQLPAPDKDSPPVAQADRASVRAGDAVTIPVLDNDTDADGDPLSLVRTPITVTGASSTTAAVGTAAVYGSTIRYAAPSTVAAPTQVSFNYVVQDPAGSTSQGTVTVTVNPIPPDKAHDQPPAPQAIEASTTSGDTLTITVPVTGVDPDGDSVTVTGITSAPKLGRISKINATSLVYQSYPQSTGTDSLTYQVTDPYGVTGTASIRIGVTPPADLQPPLAVADNVTAAPGSTIRVSVLTNDFYDQRSTTIAALKDTNKQLSEGVRLDGDDVVVPVPKDAIAPIVVTYALSEGFGQSSKAQVTVQPRVGFNNPPVARDDFPTAKAGETTSSVDVLANDSDPDGSDSDLKISGHWAAGVTQSGSKLTVGLKAEPYTVAYQVKDARGGTSVGYVHVPAKLDGAGPPRLKPDVTPIQIDKNGTKTVNIADYVEDPAGKKLQLTTTDTISASPAAGLQATSKSGTQLSLHGVADYVGPAAVTMEVTDGTSLQDPNGQRAIVSIPVQVGPVTPVFRCPTDPVSVQRGGKVQSVNLFQLCHVWTPTDADAAGVKFTSSWAKQAPGVTLSGAGANNVQLVLTPTNAAVPGKGGVITVGAQGTSAQGKLNVTVTDAPLLSMSPVVRSGVKEGSTVKLDLADYADSPLAKPDLKVLSIKQVSGMPAGSSFNGTTITLNPGPKTHGAMVFQFGISDVATDPTRQVTSTITLQVLGRPDPPGTPQKVSEGNRTVVVAFSPAAANGAPVEEYKLSDGSHSYSCPASPCTISNLHNGTHYRFTATARNIAGTSAASPQSGEMTPDALPDPVSSVKATPGDRKVLLSWVKPHNEGSAIDSYDLQISPDPGSGSIKHFPASTSSYSFGSLTNGVSYSFRLRAHNQKGFGQFGSPAPAIPFGKPAAPAAPTATGSTAASSGQAIVVTWPADDGNGRDIASYTVSGVGSGGKRLGPVSTSGLSTSFNVDNDGQTYTFSYTATNSGKLTSAKSPSSNAVRATGTPAPMSPISVVATGTSGQLQVTYQAADSHGAKTIVKYQIDGGSGGQLTTSPQKISGLTNGQTYTISAQTCNEADQCDDPVSASAYPYGSMSVNAPTGTKSGKSIDWSWSVNCNGHKCHAGWKDSAGNSGVANSNQGGSASDSKSLSYGYDKTETMTVTLYQDDAAGTTITKKSNAVTTDPQPKNPVVSIAHSTNGQSGCSYWKGGNCPYVEVTVSDIAPGTYTVQCYAEKPSSPTSQSGQYGAFGAQWNFTYSGTGTQTFNKNGSGGHCYQGYRDKVYITLSGPGSYPINSFDPW